MRNQYSKRFGTIAVEKGYISEGQLIKALELQTKEIMTEGKHRLLGQLFLEEGLLTTTQVNEILEILNQRIMYMISVGR